MRFKGTCWLAVQDIGGFTALSEQLAKKGKIGTEALTYRLQQFFRHAEMAIRDNKGHIFKLAGDAYYALFPGDLKTARFASMAKTLLKLPALTRSGLETRFVAVKGEAEGDMVDLGLNNFDLVLRGPALYDLDLMEEETPAGRIRISEGATGAAISRLPILHYRRRRGEYVPAHRPLYVGFLKIPLDFKILSDVNEFVKEKSKEIRMLKWLTSARHFKGLFIAGFPESTGKEAEIVLSLHDGLHERFPDLSMKMGVSSGMVYAGQLGGTSFREFTVIGDRVNVAARLADIAPDNGLYFSGEIEKAIKGKFTIQHVGATKLKGKEEAIEICQPIGKIMNIFDAALFPHRFIGRKKDLNRALSCVRKNINCCIVAEMGMGKSRMLYEMRRSLGDRDVVDIGIAPVSPPLAFLNSLLKHFPLGDYDDLKNCLSGMVKLPRETVIKNLGKVFSLRQGLTVFVEDLHWLDDASFSLLRELRPLPFKVIASSRPGKDVHIQELRLRRIELAPLDGEALRRLACDILGSKPDPALQRMLTDKSGGNPFYLEQLLIDLQERDLLKTAGDKTIIAEDAGSLPFSVHSILRSRFERLSAQSQRVIEIATCLGREFEIEVLTKVTAAPEIHLQKAVQDGYLAKSRGIYLFKHALFREAVMSSMLETRRRHYERRIGELFISLKKPAYEIAHHLTAGAMISDAAYYWVYAFNELYDRGLETEAAKVIKTLAESADDRVRSLGAMLDAYQLTRVADFYDAECIFKELAKNPLIRKHALFGLCSLYDWSGRYPEMKKALIPLSRCRFTKVEEIDYLELKGIYYDMTGDDQRGLECYQWTKELAQRYGFRKSLMTSLHNIGWIHIKLHDFVKARRCFNKALTLVPDGDLYNEGAMLLRLGHIDNCEGKLTVARDHLLRSLKDFQKSAFPYWERLALWNLVDNCVKSGIRSQAYAFAQKADEISRSLNKPAEVVLALRLYYGEHEKFAEAVKGMEKEKYEFYYYYLYSLGKPGDAEEFLVKNNLRIKTPTPEQLKLYYGPLHSASLYKKFVLPHRK